MEIIDMLGNALKLLISVTSLCISIRPSDATDTLQTALNGISGGPSTVDFTVNGTMNCTITSLGLGSSVSLYLRLFNENFNSNCSTHITLSTEPYQCSLTSFSPIPATLYCSGYPVFVDCKADFLGPRSAISPGQ
jgi:hypothetical protein